MTFFIILGFLLCIASVGSVVLGVLSDISDDSCCAISSLAGIIFAGGVMFVLYGFGVIV